MAESDVKRIEAAKRVAERLDRAAERASVKASDAWARWAEMAAAAHDVYVGRAVKVYAYGPRGGAARWRNGIVAELYATGDRVVFLVNLMTARGFGQSVAYLDMVGEARPGGFRLNHSEVSSAGR